MPKPVLKSLNCGNRTMDSRLIRKPHRGDPRTVLVYPVTLTPDTNDTYLVTFPDIPEAISVGDDEEDALRNARDALETAFDIYSDAGREMPVPSLPANGQSVVALERSYLSKR
jgi:antitoxin HicB